MVITVENFCKSYGLKTLFSGVSFSLSAGDKVGVVGVNGTGKSTLLKAVAGLIPIDGGETVAMKGLRIEYLAQDKELSPENSVLAEVFRGAAPLMEALRGYELALASLEKNPGDAAAERRLAGFAARIDAEGGWDLEARAKNILNKLGLKDVTVKVGELSGGEQKRLALAGALVNEADLLLLDEPTNHLDTETITWLEEYIAGLKCALLMVTHDRYFLDRTATKILELDKGHAYTYTGNYTKFLEEKQARIEREAAGEEKRQNFLRNELKWLRRGAQARSTKQKARIERYEKVKAEKPDLTRGTVEIGLAGSRLGRTVIELEGVSFEREGTFYVKDFSYTVLRRDRVGILGRNGEGKTTLLDLIAGVLTPTSGTVKIGQTVKLGYFTQQARDMDTRLRAIDYIEEAAHYLTLADGSRLTAAQLMERFLFPRDLQWAQISRLSGGERRRLYLLRILMEAPNVLLLDEPTNDLDLETMAVLESFIDDFSGAIIFVSHDRFFVDRLADKVFAFEGAGILKMYPGGYTYWQEKQEEKSKETRLEEKPSPARQEARSTPKPETRRRFTFKEQKEYQEIEAVIASKEGELTVVRRQMEMTADYGALAELSREEERLSREVSELMERWAYLEEIAEEMERS